MKSTCIKAIVIEDETRNRHYISNLISSINKEFQIIGTASNVQEGYELIKDLVPHIIFVDIKMPDGTAFDLLERFRENVFFEIIFVTGFDEYAIKAFEFNALDYVLKPIDEEKFALTIARAEKRIRDSNLVFPGNAMLNTMNAKGIMDKIPVHFNDKVQLINVEEIESIQSIDGCTVFTLSTREKYTSSKHMADFEFIFSSYSFYERISRSVFVNVNFISNYSKGLVCTLTMRTGEKFEVSRRRKTSIIHALMGGRDEGHA